MLWCRPLVPLTSLLAGRWSCVTAGPSDGAEMPSWACGPAERVDSTMQPPEAVAETRSPTPASASAALRSAIRSAREAFGSVSPSDPSVAAAGTVTGTDTRPLMINWKKASCVSRPSGGAGSDATSTAAPASSNALSDESLRASPSVWSMRIGLPEAMSTRSSPGPASIQTVFCTVGPMSTRSSPSRASTRMARKSPSGGNSDPSLVSSVKYCPSALARASGSSSRRASASASTSPMSQIRLPYSSVAVKSSRTCAAKLKDPLFSVSRVTRWWPWSSPGSVT